MVIDGDRQAAAAAASKAANKDSETRAKNFGSDEATPNKVKKAHTVAVSKKVALNISKWNQKQEELKSSINAAEAASGSAGPSTSRPIKADKSVERSLKTGDLPVASLPTEEKPVPPFNLSSSSMSEDELWSFDYSDASQNACLLCQRKLKSLEVLRRHEKESALHKGNLENLEACRDGVDRKRQLTSEPAAAQKPAGFAPIGISKNADPSPAAEPKYRDRALERRAVFGSEAPPAFTKGSGQPRVFEGPAAPTKSEEPEPVPASAEKEIDSDNIGSKMLAMMGWSKGQGLGSSGQGRTGIVETKLYAEGAGLGSTKTTTSQTPRTEAWKDYLSAAKDGARQRYGDSQDQEKDSSPG